jgi:endonuclease YncB( thermonuclease family)
MMRDFRFVVIGLFSLALSNSILAQTLEGHIVGVSDGDTVKLLDATHQLIKIRLNKIDAPEKNQAYGQKSKASLSELVFDRDVRVEVTDLDRYGRTVGILFIGEQEINLEQVHRGMAWVYRKYTSDPRYIEAEQAAREQAKGLWADAHPTPPWVFRHPQLAHEHLEPLSSPSTTTPLSGSCGSKTHCQQMRDCEEAKFYLNTCGLKTIDGDGDGIPCEKLCSAR